MYRDLEFIMSIVDPGVAKDIVVVLVEGVTSVDCIGILNLSCP